MSTETFARIAWKDGDAAVSWKALKDAAAYRCALRDDTEEQHSTIYLGPDNSCSIPRSKLEKPHRYSLRIEAQFSPDSRQPEWKTLAPFCLLLDANSRNPPAEVLKLSVPANADHSKYSAYRLIVRNDFTETIIVDERSFGVDFNLDLTRIAPSDDHRYKFLGFLDGKWSDLGRYEELSLPRDDDAGDRITLVPQDKPAVAGATAPSLLYLFTVDTEANLRLMRSPSYERAFEEQILCRWEGREVGITYLMDELEKRGFKGTFFLDILMEFQLGRETVERTIELIRGRGHDIQLHLHPSPHLHYSENANIRSIATSYGIARTWKQGNATTADAFARSLDIALDLFKKRVGCDPVAFRNGSYFIEDEFFPILAERGIKLDSSIYAHKNFYASDWMKTQAAQYRVHRGLIEVPVSWLLYRNKDGGKSTTPYQYALKAGSVETAIALGLKQAAEESHGLNALVTVTHSYSLVGETRQLSESFYEDWNKIFKSIAPNEVYAKLKMDSKSKTVVLENIDNKRIDIFSRMLDSVSQHAGIRVVTMQELHDRYLDDLDLSERPYQSVAEFHPHTKKTRQIGLQHYSASYLEWLENHDGSPSH